MIMICGVNPANIKMGFMASVGVDFVVDYFTVKHPEEINAEFSRNPHRKAVSYLCGGSAPHPNVIAWREFSRNESDDAVTYALANLDKVDWLSFSANPNPIAVRYLLKHPEKIDASAFSTNSCDEAVSMLMARPALIVWNKFAENQNPIAVAMVLKRNDVADLSGLAKNPNHDACRYTLEHLPESAPWDSLSENPNRTIIEYMLEHPRNINWQKMSANKGIWETARSRIVVEHEPQ
jgi:hypothetical protein